MSSGNESIKLPPSKSLVTAADIAIKKDKPILLDYYNDSLTGECYLGKNQQDNTVILIKSQSEFTSNISTMKKPSDTNTYIIETENSIYIVSASIPIKTIKTS
jgi:hypothetical protein